MPWPARCFSDHLRPSEHRATRTVDFPAEFPQAIHHDVPPLLVEFVLCGDIVFAFAHGDNRGDLNRLENAVVVVALDGRESPDHLAIAHAEADPPPSHIIRLGEGHEFHADVFGAAGLHEARSLVAVETRPPVGEVVDHINAFAFGEIDDASKNSTPSTVMAVGL